jgi:MOSC domain-containing protein
MHVTHLWRYPVKSMAGEPLTDVLLGPQGMPYDRHYCVVDGEPTRKGNTLTARVAGDLLAYRAAAGVDGVRVTAADDGVYEIGDAFAARLGSALGRPLSFTTAQPDEAFHDAYGLLVLNAASVRALQKEWGKPLDPVRFRPNIMIDGDDLEAYAENGWIGRRFRAGAAVLEGAAHDQRCVLPTIDPRTLERDPSLLRLIVEHHNQCFGLYCSVVQAGKLAVGDEWTAV